MVNESSKILLKDLLFNKKNVDQLTLLIREVYPSFDDSKFSQDILLKFPELELKERIHCISEKLLEILPKDYNRAIDVLLRAIKVFNENNLEKEGFIFTAFSYYVAENGCNKDDLEISLNALGEFTKYASAEFAIRDFINKFPDRTFLKMIEWSKSKNVHQRRLASEGLRPKLPWASGINFDYKKGSEVLDNLFYDRERYVTRSVANHLNDISKFHHNFVISKLTEWGKSGRQDSSEMDYITRHSLRTSIKKGHIETLNFLGYDHEPKVLVRDLKIEDKIIRIGETLKFSFNIIPKVSENIVVDYKIIYPNPSKRVSEKVFKIKKFLTHARKTIHIGKKHLFRKMTTKKLYSGTYKLEIQINGKSFGSVDFDLKID